MGSQDNDEEGCEICGSSEGLSYAIVTEEPVEDGDLTDYDPYPFCEVHMGELTEQADAYVRQLPPIPDERGGFNRTHDGELEVLYDGEGDVTEEAWIRFDPETDEIGLQDIRPEE